MTIDDFEKSETLSNGKKYDKLKKLKNLGKSEKLKSTDEPEESVKSEESDESEKPEKKPESLIKKLYSFFIKEDIISPSVETEKDDPEPHISRGLFRYLINPPKTEIDDGKFSFLKLPSRYLRYRHKEKKDIESRSVYEEIEHGARPTPDYWVLTLFSCIIATLGLIQNSSAVIIGAMIIAPLMGPIMGLSMGTVWGEIRLFWRSLKAILISLVLSVLISAAISVIAQIEILPMEVLSRTTPNLYDLGIALACGWVGAYAICAGRISSALPGVAISVALMPPLCTIGICVGKLNFTAAGGAFILYLTNLLAISFAACLVFWYKRVHPAEDDSTKIKARISRHLLFTALLLVITTIPLIYFSLIAHGLTKAKIISQKVIENFIPDQYLHQYSVSDKVDPNGKKYKLIKLHLYTGFSPTPDDWKKIKKKLKNVWGKEIKLEIRKFRSEFTVF
jgi:uncharacterized hydrophobic protein (TIGR00271 family)